MINLDKIIYNFLLIFTVVIFIQKESSAVIYTIDAPLGGNQEVPPNPSTA